jgi:23S rRNA G2445 N2-methylase RlmL
VCVCVCVSANSDVIVGNPPWGKNIGVGEDALRIVRNLARSFPAATAGYVVSEWTYNQLQDSQVRGRLEERMKAGLQARR